ncbi:hypothetical protein BSLG_010431 [Batrachochytrium salamandrivorans]|nr:hypothetical protein BSLG_010431 [Batrachochytrium salamandrivorans]
MKFFTFFIAAMATATSVAAVAIPYANRAEHHPDMLQKRSNSIDMISLDSNSPQGTVHLERRAETLKEANADAQREVDEKVAEWKRKIEEMKATIARGEGNTAKLEKKIKKYEEKIAMNTKPLPGEIPTTTNGSQTVVKQDDEGGKDDADGKDGEDAKE